MNANVNVIKTNTDSKKLVEIEIAGLPATFGGLVDTCELTINGKLKPLVEIEVSFTHVTDDGYMLTIGGKLPLWLDKLTTKRVLEAKEHQARVEKIKIKEKELEAKLAIMSEEELRELLKKAMLK